MPPTLRPNGPADQAPQNHDDGVGSAPGDSQIDDDTEHQDDEQVSKRDGRYREQMRESQDLAAQAIQAAGDLAGKLEQVQKAHIETLVSSRLSDPSSVWLTGAQPGQFYTEDGTPDSDKIAAHVNDLLAATKPAPVKHGYGSFPADAVTAAGKMGDGPHVRNAAEWLSDAATGRYSGKV
ncbi:hypothetical protein [Mycobacterium sp.]|uniref:hypothetical protein n=1 Tax=Mycobacterium sp. TaxID=1785 RepID=UPI003F9821CC